MVPATVTSIASAGAGTTGTAMRINVAEGDPLSPACVIYLWRYVNFVKNLRLIYKLIGRKMPFLVDFWHFSGNFMSK